MVELTRVEEVTGLIPDPALCNIIFTWSFLLSCYTCICIIKYLALLVKFLFCFIFAYHFYLKKKKDMLKLFLLCVLCLFLDFIAIWYHSHEKKPQKQIYFIFAIFTTNNYKKIYSIYMYRVLKYSMDCRDTSETPLGVLKIIGFVSLMIIMNWM